MVIVRISQEAPLEIFDHPSLQGKITQLFTSFDQAIEARFNEIIKFLQVQPIDIFSYGSIQFLFKMFFFKGILSEAVKRSFTGECDYNVLSNIDALLTKERLNDAIYGEPMIEAFSYAIHNKDNRKVYAPHLGERSFRLLEIKFLGKSLSESKHQKK